MVCNITDSLLYKTRSMWVGNHSGDIAVHQNCPLDYCKSNVTAVDPYNQQDQCDYNRSGVLCGACRPGLSLVLGTSQCKLCSNVYLLLLIPLALAGVVLVLILLKCNLTVSTGTINGLIFYVNIVQAAKTAFFPTGSNSTFTHILSVSIAWLNLDLGIETCFAEGLNTYYRTWLQFVFPVYIWSLVGVIIVVSRYSIRVSRWTGSNTVSVLATLFLLSYTKLLRVTVDALSFTTLTDANGTTTLVWLLDGDYVFLQWPHSLLFTAALVTLLGHIVPFTALLLMSPTLQRYSHHKPLRWVNRLKPLLDAYQGPYTVKMRYWTGLLLLLRLIILTAIAFNVTGNQAINLLIIIVIVLVLMIFYIVLLMWFEIEQLYRNKFSNILELFYFSVLLFHAIFALYFRTNPVALTYIMVGSSLLLFLLIILYHCYHACYNSRIGKAIKMKTKTIEKSCFGKEISVPQQQTTKVPTVTYVELNLNHLWETHAAPDNFKQENIA